jgi:hypothetical protein
MCTPAAPKPMPASDAASIIHPRASSSPRTALRRYRPPYSSPFADQMSEIGVAPWYGGRSPGEAGAGRESCVRAVNDSAAWQMTSSPHEATTSGARLAVGWGSTIA